MTPEETQEELLKSMRAMVDMMTDQNTALKRQVELTELSTDSAKKANKLRATTVDDEKKISEKIAKNYKFRLGMEEETNPKLKKVLDDRFDIEQRIADQAKRNFGEDVFQSAQRNKLFREQLKQYSEGNLAYGGVVTQFKDFSKQQQDAIVDAAKSQKKLRMGQENLTQTVQALSNVKFSDLSKQQQVAVVEAAKIQQQLQKEQEKFTKTVRDLANPGASIKDMSGKFASMSSAVDAGKESLIKLAGGGVGATAGIELLTAGAKLAGAALDGAAKALKQMGIAVFQGERGMAVGAKGVETFTKSITGAVDAFGSLLMGIGGVLIALAPFSLGLGAVAGAGVMAAGAVLKLGASAANTAAELNVIAATANDKLFAAFEELGKASMTGAQGMEGVADNLHKIGLTTYEFEKFNKVISANSGEMKMFGTTAADGVAKFSEAAGKLAGPNSDIGKAFRLMGIGAEEQYEHTAKNMALEARLGLLRDKSAAQVLKSNQNYIEELDKIAEITGITRREQEEGMKFVMANEQFRAGMNVEQRRLAANPDDKDAKKRLEDMEKVALVAAVLEKQGATRQATGALQKYGAGNALTTEESVEFHIGNPEFDKALKAGAEFPQLLLMVNKSIIDNSREVAHIASLGASTKGMKYGDTQAAAGNIAATTETLLKERDAERAKQGSKFDENKFINDFYEKRKATDPTTEDNVKIQLELQKKAIDMDKWVVEYNRNVGINKWATEQFKKAVDLFGDIIGYKAKPKAAPNEPDIAVKELLKLSKPLEEQVDLLNKQIDVDEENLKKAKAAGVRGEDLKKLEDKILKSKEEYGKSVDALIAHEDRIKRATMQENAERREANKKPLPMGDQGLLEQISRGEGTSDDDAKKNGFKSGYDVPYGSGKYGGKTDKPLSEMTFGEAKEYQKKIINDQKAHGIPQEHRSGALGKYQFISDTLKAQQEAGGFKDTDKFDAAAQDKMAAQLLKLRGIDQFKSGKMSGADFQLGLSQEWASVARPDTGKSYYGQPTGTSDAQIKRALAGTRSMMPESALPVPAKPPATLNEQTALPVTDAALDSAADIKAAQEWSTSNKRDRARIEKITGISPEKLLSIANASKPVVPSSQFSGKITDETKPPPVALKPAPVALKPVEQSFIDPNFNTATQAEIDKTKEGRDKWFLSMKPKTVPIADLKKPETANSVAPPTPADFSRAATAGKNDNTVKKESPPVHPISKVEAPINDRNVTYEMVSMISLKLDTMIDKLSSGNDTQEKLLMYSRS